MTNKTCWKVLVCLLTVALFASCKSASPYESEVAKSVPSTYPVFEKTDLKLLTKWNGVCFGAGGEKGFYYPEIQLDGSSLIMYLDYASQTQTVLCANLNCQHQDDTCTAWFPANQGGLIPLVMDDSLFLLSKGSDNIEPYTSSPQITRMNLNGENRKTLVELKASEELLSPFVSNDHDIICICRKFDESSSSITAEEIIVALDVSSGQFTELFSFPDNSMSIVGASANQLFLQTVKDDKFHLCSFQMDTCELKTLDTWSYSDKLFFSTQKGYGFVTSDGTIEFYTQPHFKKQKFEGIAIPLDEKIGLESLTFVDSYDDKVIFEVYSPGDTPADTVVKQYGLDTTESTLHELSLHTNFDGVTDPINIIAHLEDRLVVVSALSYQQKTMLDKNDMPMQVQTIGQQYALIDKADYWNSIPNYQELKSIWF